jgi:putative SOS response-associated peptidase YedK
MCGRYAASRRPEDLVEEFEVDESLIEPAAEPPGAARPDPSTVASAATEELAPSWNVAPTDPVAVVLERRPRGQPEGTPARRLLRLARWGLVPSWAKDASVGSRMINARVETVADKPAFRKAFASRRCLVPADGYYEWYTPEAAADAPGGRGRKGKPAKQPFFIRPRGGGVLAMAGLYELWRDRSASDTDPGAWLWTCAILTTTAEDSLGRIHDRMPMLIERERFADWLDPSRSDPAELRGLLVPAAPGRLEAYPVSTAVNSVRNNGPQLVEPEPAEPAAAEVARLF